MKFSITIITIEVIMAIKINMAIKSNISGHDDHYNYCNYFNCYDYLLIFQNQRRCQMQRLHYRVVKSFNNQNKAF